MRISGLRAFSQEAGAKLQIATALASGVPVAQESVALPAGDELDWAGLKLEPGQARWIEVTVEAAKGRLETERLLITKAGSTPAKKYAGIKAAQVKPISEVFATETLSIFEPLETAKPAVDTFLAGMKRRNSDAVQLNTNWTAVEPVTGVYDWSRLDAYVDYLTEKKTPFVLGTMGSALFMNLPYDAWGEWMANHQGETQLWRELPVVTPLGARYRAATKDYIGRMVERYRDNPYLVGYNFINQGADSGVYMDNAGSIADYSPTARAQFKEFVRSKYGTLDKLNARWGSDFGSWDAVEPPLPRFTMEVDISPAWQDFTAFKMVHFKAAISGLFDDVVRQRDTKRPIGHYAGYVGPIEYLFADFAKNGDIMADGGGEDVTIGRMNGVSRNWGIGRNTESHAVPPANRLAMQDMATNLLRYGLKDNRFNLVWNTMVSLHDSTYPKNEPLQDSMKWWSGAIPELRTLGQSVPEKARVGTVLSWSDMLYRTRLWRWYTMPGRTVDDMTQAASLLPATWVTELTPAEKMAGLELIIVPSDATVWDPALTEKLKNFVQNGGKLAVWGKSGQYTPNEAGSFFWLKALGQSGATVNVRDAAANASLNWQGQKVTVPVSLQVDGMVGATPVLAEDKTAAALQWNFGKGQVCWLLGDPAGTQLAETGRMFSSWAKVKPAIESSDARIQGFWLNQGAKRYLVLSQFLGFGAIKRVMDQPVKPPAVKANITLPTLPAGKWRMKWISPGKTETQAYVASGFGVEMNSSDLQVIEFEALGKK